MRFERGVLAPILLFVFLSTSANAMVLAGSADSPAAPSPEYSTPLAAADSEPIWLDADTLRLYLEPLREWLGRDYERLSARLHGARVEPREDELQLTLFLKRKFDLLLKREAEAETGSVYRVHFPATLRIRIRQEGEFLRVSGFRAVSGFDRLRFRVKLPVLPDDVLLHSVDLDLGLFRARAEASVIGPLIPIVADAEFRDGKPVIGVDLLDTTLRNLGLLAPLRFRPAKF